MREGSGCPSVTSQGFPSLRATKTIAEVLLKQRGKGRKEMVEQQVPGFGGWGKLPCVQLLIHGSPGTPARQSVERFAWERQQRKSLWAGGAVVALMWFL